MHYMVDTTHKVDAIVSGYIERSEYFTINRARQYGKTTTLDQLHRRLSPTHVVIDISFEGKEDYFVSLESMANGVLTLVSRRLASEGYEDLANLCAAPLDESLPLDSLSVRITELCAAAGKGIVLMIDEVDRAADFDVFASFLGLLRDKYIERNRHNTPTFQSVVLAGVHDIKNLKKKIRPDDEHSYNSPWNIAASFDLDMSFSPAEITTMLGEYEKENNTCMDMAVVSERLHYYTGGYPFLVSRLCKTIDESSLEWSVRGIEEAETAILSEKNTLFDDMIKNVANNHDLRELVESLLLEGAVISYDPYNKAIDLGMMYGILKKREDNKLQIHNVIFETVLTNWLISESETRSLTEKYAYDTQFVKNGKLDIAMVIKKFAEFMKSEYRDEDGDFIEQHARLLFLSFLKPIVNGTGHYAVEPQTRGNRRMDVVVYYGKEEFIIELKIWRGDEYEKQAFDQLAGYLDSKGKETGYLISFCDNKTTPRPDGTFIHKGHEITEAIVAYRDNV
jgi:hypothetical protein